MRIKSLRTKILLTMSIVLVISLLISVFLTVRVQRAHLVKHHMEHQKSLLQVVKNGIQMPMTRNQPDEIRSTLLGLMTQTEIISLRIISSEGEIRYSTKPEEVQNRLPEEMMDRLRGGERDTYLKEHYEGDQHSLTVVERVENNPSCQGCHSEAASYVGFLAIETDISSIDDDLAISRKLSIFTTLGTFLLLVAAVGIVHLRFVQRSLKKVLKGITEVEKGNFQTHIDVQSTDEMGHLADSFNNMIDRLNQMRKELKQAHQSQLERADKLANVGELAAGMAHEIKNPVAGISSAIKIIHDDLEENDSHRPIFEEVLRQIERVDLAVNSLLSYARPQPPNFTLSNMTEIVTRSLNLAGQRAGAAKIKLVYTGDKNLPEMVVDSQQIEQVLVNLIMNAIQSMPEGGKLEVEQNYDSESGAVEVRIRDTGKGIEEENLGKIFKPFFTTKHRGTGLGLAICRGIIERHGGKITVESTPGIGSIFTIILPIKERSGKANENE